jgi:hypothetical protein
VAKPVETLAKLASKLARFSFVKILMRAHIAKISFMKPVLLGFRGDNPFLVPYWPYTYRLGPPSHILVNICKQRPSRWKIRGPHKALPMCSRCVDRLPPTDFPVCRPYYVPYWLARLIDWYSAVRTLPNLLHRDYPGKFCPTVLPTVNSELHKSFVQVVLSVWCGRNDVPYWPY